MNARPDAGNRKRSIEITEGRLTFTFGPRCNAIKYDSWAFYRNHFCKITNGLKAVDMICIDTGMLWLIEVKDYRTEARSKTLELADEIALKAVYSISGLFAASVNASNQDEKSYAIQARRCDRIGLVFHIEQSANHSKLFPHIIDLSKFALKLRQKLKALDPHPKVVNQATLHHTMGWTVKG